MGTRRPTRATMLRHHNGIGQLECLLIECIRARSESEFQRLPGLNTFE